jgi:hypothetical protein
MAQLSRAGYFATYYSNIHTYMVYCILASCYIRFTLSICSLLVTLMDNKEQILSTYMMFISDRSGNCPEPHKSSSTLLSCSFKIRPTSYPQVSKMVYFFRTSHHDFVCIYLLSHACCMLHILPLVLSSQYLTSSITYRVPFFSRLFIIPAKLTMCKLNQLALDAVKVTTCQLNQVTVGTVKVTTYQLN